MTTSVLRDEYRERNEDIEYPKIIYRFKFTNIFMNELYHFSKLHQYDDRKDFKDEWELWTKDNKTIINDERKRLNMLGYDGDILSKMFKSARYYFRKKNTGKKQPIKRRPYISVPHELLEEIDKHITSNIFNADYQPKNGFETFWDNNQIIINETIHNINKQGITEITIIKDKIKKTYKNRYFILTNKTYINIE